MRCIQVVYFLKVVMHFAPLSALCSLVGKFLGLKTKKKRFNRFFLCERNKKSLRFFFLMGLMIVIRIQFFFIIHVLNEGILQKIRYHDGGHKKFKGNEFEYTQKFF